MQRNEKNCLQDFVACFFLVFNDVKDLTPAFGRDSKAFMTQAAQGLGRGSGAEDLSEPRLRAAECGHAAARCLVGGKGAANAFALVLGKKKKTNDYRPTATITTTIIITTRRRSQLRQDETDWTVRQPHNPKCLFSGSGSTSTSSTSSPVALSAETASAVLSFLLDVRSTRWDTSGVTNKGGLFEGLVVYGCFFFFWLSSL